LANAWSTFRAEFEQARHVGQRLADGHAVVEHAVERGIDGILGELGLLVDGRGGDVRAASRQSSRARWPPRKACGSAMAGSSCAASSAGKASCVSSAAIWRAGSSVIISISSQASAFLAGSESRGIA